MAFSRGLYTGWFRGTDNQELVHANFGTKRGVFLGEVIRVGADRVSLRLVAPLKPGDGVVFDAGQPETKEEGGRVYQVEPRGGGNRAAFRSGRHRFPAGACRRPVLENQRSRAGKTHPADLPGRTNPVSTTSHDGSPRSRRPAADVDRKRRTRPRGQKGVGRGPRAGRNPATDARAAGRAARPAGRHALPPRRSCVVSRGRCHPAGQRAQPAPSRGRDRAGTAAVAAVALAAAGTGRRSDPGSRRARGAPASPSRPS